MWKLCSTMCQGDWAYSKNLKHAYFHVPIRHSSLKYLQFAVNRRRHDFQVPPFGISIPPWLFTRITPPVISTITWRPISTDLNYRRIEYSWPDSWPVSASSFIWSNQNLCLSKTYLTYRSVYSLPQKIVLLPWLKPDSFWFLYPRNGPSIRK